jgi:D-alanyl-D-alanine carboxypeptidase
MLLGEAIKKVTGRPLETVLRRDLVNPAGLSRVNFWDARQPGPDLAAPASSSRLSNHQVDVLVNSFADTEAGASGMVADAMSVARWGYQLYGARVLPTDAVADDRAGRVQGERLVSGTGLGTMLFSQTLGLGDAYGHEGRQVGFQSLLAVVPNQRAAFALLIADEQKNVSEPMQGPPPPA